MCAAAINALLRRFTTIYLKFTSALGRSRKWSSIVEAQTDEVHVALDGKFFNQLLPGSVNPVYRYRKHLTAVGNTKSQAYILKGGIKAWLKEFAHVDELVDTD